MAGSFQHCLNGWSYVGTDALENMGDMKEAVDHMAFMLLQICHENTDGAALVRRVSREYYECARRERPWPEFMKPGIEA